LFLKKVLSFLNLFDNGFVKIGFKFFRYFLFLETKKMKIDSVPPLILILVVFSSLKRFFFKLEFSNKFIYFLLK